MKKVFLCLIFILFTLPSNIYAQQDVIDSLKKELEVVEIDSTKVKIYYELAKIYIDVDLSEGIEYIEEGLTLSYQTNYFKGISRGLRLRGKTFLWTGKVDEAIKYVDSAYYYASRKNDYIEILNVKIAEGAIYATISDNKRAIEILESLPQEAKKHGLTIEYGISVHYLTTAYNSNNQYKESTKILNSTLRDLVAYQGKNADKILKIVAGLKNTLSINLYRQGNYIKALKIIDDNEKYYAKTGNIDGLIISYSRRSSILCAQGKHKEALKYNLEHLRLIKETKQDLRLPIAYQNLSSEYEHLGDTLKSIEYGKKSLAIFRDMNDIRGIMENTVNIAISYSGMKEYNHALEYLYQADSLAKKQTISPRMMANLYGELSTIYLLKKMRPIAEILSMQNTALQYALKTEDPYLIKDFYQELYQSNQKMGNYKKALSNYEKYTTIKDSLITVEKSKELDNLQIQYETEKKEAENARLKAENAQKEAEVQARNNGLMAGGVILLLLGIFTVFVSRSRQKIQAKNTEIDTLYKEHAHRTKNQFSTLVSLQNRQLRQLEGTVETSFLLETRNQINIMSLIHKELNQNSSEYQTEIALNDYLRDLTYNIVSSYGKNTDNFEIKTDLAEVKMEASRCSTLGLIVNELASNALKYAYEGIEKPMLSISLKEEGKMLRLTVQDNGKGFEESGKNTTSKGLNLVESLTKQLHGDLKRSTDNGTRYEITFTN